VRFWCVLSVTQFTRASCQQDLTHYLRIRFGLSGFIPHTHRHYRGTNARPWNEFAKNAVKPRLRNGLIRSIPPLPAVMERNSDATTPEFSPTCSPAATSAPDLPAASR